mmetsp:Transcript_15699/g.28648  ORF Transcript_15699/g.28648 Transcript_15699/m.28648 type:complete len:123 (+) Transcript_15699:1719-2087(+)
MLEDEFHLVASLLDLAHCHGERAGMVCTQVAGMMTDMRGFGRKEPGMKAADTKELDKALGMTEPDKKEPGMKADRKELGRMAGRTLMLDKALELELLEGTSLQRHQPHTADMKEQSLEQAEG